ncbi:hypothetical protein [Dictyobacter arantiisoli]|uniref:Uncharacterized protein n=1 Tax=Dictyobacter arantiisoli TaxID=2014874 RepID=A0A5A5TD42_9CHLR|nr:hypothetical protein [Dictyobacter arantiisoli]GCF08949.1 hypothetical protein KDI_25130 [Dictyobacter arantiisoli]
MYKQANTHHTQCTDSQDQDIEILHPEQQDLERLEQLLPSDDDKVQDFLTLLALEDNKILRLSLLEDF